MNCTHNSSPRNFAKSFVKIRRTSPLLVLEIPMLKMLDDIQNRMIADGGALQSIRTPREPIRKVKEGKSGAPKQMSRAATAIKRDMKQGTATSENLTRERWTMENLDDPRAKTPNMFCLDTINIMCSNSRPV